MDDWIPLNSLLDSHDHVDPLDKKAERDVDIDEEDFDEGSARASWKAVRANERMEGFDQEYQEKSDSCECNHWDT